MPYSDNKSFNTRLSLELRFVVLLISILAIILFAVKSLTNLSAGTLFTYPEIIAADAFGVKQISLADINNDSYLDIVAVNSTSNSIDVYVNPSSTSAIWTKKPLLSNTQGLLSTLTIDVDNDSDIDIIYSDTNSLAITMMSNIDGLGTTWQSSTVTSTAGAIKSMCSGDLNGDGNLDIVAADDFRGRIFYMQNRLHINNTWKSFSIYENPKNPSSLKCHDIDNDKDIDVVSTSQSLNTITWHENKVGNGSEWETHTILNTSSFANNIYVTDLDNDSLYDLVSTNPASSTIHYHKNVAGDAKTWESSSIQKDWGGPTDLLVKDLDLDGDDDLIASSNQLKKVIWIENNSSLEDNWGSSPIGSIINYPSTIKSADIDKDGDEDIIIGSLANSNISIAKNMLSQTSHNSMSDILKPSRENHISVVLGQALVSNNNLFGADNTVLVSIYDPNKNLNPQTIDTIPSPDITIKNLNSQDTANISLTETNVNSSMFIGEFFVDTDYSTTNIKAKDFEQIQILYKANDNISITAYTNTNQEHIVVDGTPPSISNIYPNKNIKDSTSSHKFEAIIEDSIIGLGNNLNTVKGNIEFIIDDYSFEPNLTYLGYGRWLASLNINLSEGIHTWQISSSDLLSNLSNSKQFELEVDLTPPYFVNTGNNKSRTGDTVLNSNIIKSSNRKSIRLEFDDNIDGKSVDLDGSDFQVFLEEIQIETVAAKWINSPTTSKHIFITLKDELPPDAKPTVKLRGAIRDDAGNTSNFDKTIVSDGINPNIQFTLSGTNNEARIITNGNLTLEVISDEIIVNPNISSVTIETLDSNNSPIATSISPKSFSTISSNTQWRWEYSFDNLSNQDNLYNVNLQLQDFSGNIVTVNNPDLSTNSNSTLFEVDTVIETGSLALDTSPKPYSYINIDYSVEANEYTNDSHNKTQIIESSVDGLPITIQTYNHKLFTISPPKEGWSVGEHEINLKVKDDAGNTGLFETRFNVSPEPVFTINLKPGFNLISLPANPSNSDINSVLLSTHSVNSIMTYDPTNGGTWLVSERNPETNLFEGAITQVDASKAYLLRTNSFESLQIDLKKTFLHDGNLPTTISLYQGWNFVPVINLSDQYISTKGVLAGEYFKNINPTSILGINQFNNLSPIDENEKLLYGKGYLVYLDYDDVLVPPK